MFPTRLLRTVLIWLTVIGCAPCHAGTVGSNGESLSLLILRTNNESTFVVSIDTTHSSFELGESDVGALAVKIGDHVNSARLDSVLFNGTNVTSDFVLYVNSGVAANGCTGAGSGFVCIEAASPGSYFTPSIMTFIFTSTRGNGRADTRDAFNVKARYIKNERTIGTITSTYVPVPEPGVIYFLVTGLGILTAFRQFSKRQATQTIMPRQNFHTLRKKRKSRK